MKTNQLRALWAHSDHTEVYGGHHSVSRISAPLADSGNTARLFHFSLRIITGTYLPRSNWDAYSGQKIVRRTPKSLLLPSKFSVVC